VHYLLSFFLVLFCVAILLGYASAQDNATVPNIVKFSGTVSSAPAGTVGVIFALYKDQTGGAPLWQEVQTVTVDASGHYTSLLGSSTTAGIPLDVFSSNEARWLGVQAQGQAEQARVLLVSVPYALKAADAQTLGGLPPSAFLRADAATVAAPATATTTDFVNEAALKAAINPSLTPVDDAGWLSGYLPTFDSSGNLTNSALNQLVTSTTTYLGFGTPVPQFNLHFTGTVDPAAVTIDGYGAVGINFIGRRAEGTLANPSGLLANDNIMTMQGRGWGTTGFSPISRAYMKFFAAEAWTDAAQGTYISLATTPKGTASTNGSTERMRITDAGNVGVGTTTPAYPLSVNGAIQSMTGGFIFPNGTTQVTAAVSGVALTSPDASITVGGTNTAPTVAVNTTNIQKRVTGACNVGQSVTSVNADGSVNCIAGPQGPPGTSAPVVKDANGNVLGTLISLGGFNGTDVKIYTKGYFVTVGINGLFPVGPQTLNNNTEIDWSGTACNGTAYMETANGLPIITNFPNTYTKTVVYSAQANVLMIPAGTGVSITAVNYSANSSEIAGFGTPDYTDVDGVSYCSPRVSTTSGWPLVAINPATTLGWTVSGNPLSVAGPLQLP
jgi:hypothetical protein